MRLPWSCVALLLQRKSRYAILFLSKQLFFLLQPKSEVVRTQAVDVCSDRPQRNACGEGSCLLSGSSSCLILPRARAPPHPIISLSPTAWVPGRTRALHPLPSTTVAPQQKKGKCSS